MVGCRIQSLRPRLRGPAALLALCCALACATPTLRERAERGDVDAQVELGDSLLGDPSQAPVEPVQPDETGLAPESNPEEALRWYQRAAEQGDVRAQLKLAEIYYAGDAGVDVDYETSAEWAQKAADQGYAPAQSFVGGLHRLGRGVPHNYTLAVRWYRLAGEQGDAGAQFYMGTAYDFGVGGVKPDPHEALRWYLLAADQGWEKAQLNAGLLFLHDDPAIRDEVQAFKWLLLAASMGNRQAYDTMNQMLTQMTREQILEAGELVGEWRRERGLTIRSPDDPVLLDQSAEEDETAL